MKETRDEARQGVLLDELKDVAAKLGLRIREERLLREVGYRVRSGSCRVRQEEVLFIDRGLPVSAQIELLLDELSRRTLENVYVSPAVRTLLERAAARAKPRDEGDQTARS